MPSGSPSNITFLDRVIQRIEHRPDARALILVREDGERESMTFADVHREASAWARELETRGVGTDDVVLIALDHSRPLIGAIVGTWYAGAAPAVTRYPGHRLDPLAHARWLASHARAACAPLLVVEPDMKTHLREVGGASLALLSPDEVDRDALLVRRPRASAEALAYVQYTSGTSGAQKGVAHTHRAMREYLEAKIAADAITDDSVVVNWLPLYHDLGLLSGLLTPLFAGIPTVLISPFHWVRDPKLLLRCVHDFRGTVSWMPNFGLEHCARAIREHDLEGVELDSWRSVVCGGELVRYASQRAFLERFAPYGLRASALHAGYGMAENVEGITTSRKDRAVSVDWVGIAELRTEGRAVPRPADAAGAVPIVSCGSPLPGTRVRVVDPEGGSLPERRVGEITVQSRYCLSAGYHRRPDLTCEAMKDGWLYTGDLGYVADGELFVCGRKKDLIIVAGGNVQPEDLETVAGDIRGVIPGRAVAFGLPHAMTGTERVVLVCELLDGIDAEQAREAEQLIRRRCARELDVAISEVAFRKRGWIVKSSSGKLARPANREKYLSEGSMRSLAEGSPS